MAVPNESVIIRAYDAADCNQVVALFRLAKTVPAAIGRAAPKAAQCSVTSIAGACETMPRHIHGIRRILREGLTAAAAKMICAAPAVTGCSIVLLHDRSNAILTVSPCTMLASVLTR